MLGSCLSTGLCLSDVWENGNIKKQTTVWSCGLNSSSFSMIRMDPFHLGIVHESVIFQHALLMLAEASEDRQAALKAFVRLLF